jgi:hypothetical protein
VNIRSAIAVSALLFGVTPAYAQLGLRTAATEKPPSIAGITEARARDLEREIARELEAMRTGDERLLRERLRALGVSAEILEKADLSTRVRSPTDTASFLVNNVRTASATPCLGVWPVATLAEAKCFWQQSSVSTLRSARVVGSEDRGTAALEIVSGLMGPVRFDVTTSLTSGSAETEEQATERRVQQLLASGGNFSIRALFPLYGRTFGTGGGSAVLYSRAGAVLDWLGEELAEGQARLGDTDASIEAGIETDMEFATENREIVFSIFGRVAAVHGTGPFHAAVGSGKRNMFGMAHGGIGFRLNELVTLALSGRWFFMDESIPSGGPMISLILTPAPARDVE